MLSGDIHGGDSDGVDRIGVSIEIALIPRTRAVPTGEDEDAPFALSSILYPIQHGLLDQVGGRLHASPIIRGTPGARVDGRLVEPVVEGGGFVRVGDGPREDSETRDLALVRDA